MKKCFSLLAGTLMMWCCVGMIPAAEPTIELRVKAVKDLLPLAPYLADFAGQAEQAEQGVKFVEAMAGKKGIIEGIDITKPIGLYASMTPNVIDSPIVAFVPVGDETAFLNLLKGKINLSPEKGDGDIYSLNIPGVPPTVYFKFFNGYACVAVHNKSALSEDQLLDPTKFFEKKEDAVLALSVHFNRIPADVRKTFLGQLELKLADEKAKPAGSPAEEKAKAFVMDGMLNGIKKLMDEGKTASLKLQIDPKTDDIGLEFDLNATSGTDLNALLNSAVTRKSVAPLAAVKDAIVSVAVNVQVPETMKKNYGEIMDLVIAEALEKAQGNDRDVAKRFFEALEPTMKAGVFQLGLSLSAAGKDQHEFLMALKVASGKEIEKLAKEFAPFIPEGQAKVNFDVEKLGSALLHQVIPPANDQVEKLFGKSSVWLTTSDDLIVAGLSPTSDSVKKVAAFAAAPAPIVSVSVSVAQLMPIVEPKTNPAIFKSLNQDVFQSETFAGKDTFTLTVTGGNQLTVRLSMKGKAAKYLALLQQKKAGS